MRLELEASLQAGLRKESSQERKSNRTSCISYVIYVSNSTSSRRNSSESIYLKKRQGHWAAEDPESVGGNIRGQSMLHFSAPAAFDP